MAELEAHLAGRGIMYTGQPKRFTAIDGCNLAAVVALCAVAAVLLWCKLNYLVWFDPAWWLQEMFRFAHGQVPYRDYFWPYPPLTVIVFGTALRLLGDKFWVMQAVLNVFSLAVMLGVYFWTRYLVPTSFHLLTCVLVLAVSVTTQTYFSLFSFLTYGPTLHVSATGLLLLLLAVLRYIRSPVADSRSFPWMGLGALLALTSKLDSIVAVGVIFVFLAVFDQRIPKAPLSGWIRYYAGLALLWFAPAAAVYLLVGRWAGFANMLLGIRGNGLANVACPWWPTGFGLLGAAGALGCALLVGAAATLCDYRRWRAYLGRPYYLLLAGALVGGCVYACFMAAAFPEIVFGPDSLGVKVRRLVPELLSTNAVFRPALWMIIVYWSYLLVRNLNAIRTGAIINGDNLALFLVLTVPVSLSPRGLFGRHLMPYPEVPALCYPFVMVVAIYLILRWLRMPYGLADRLTIEVPRRPGTVVAVMTLGYVAARLIAGYPEILSNSKFTRLDTPAGVVRVKDAEVSRALVAYVLSQTTPADSILEVPHGGGIGFATGRQSFSFSTLWSQLPVPESVQALDLQKLRENPPLIVIASKAEHFGSFDGVYAINGCMFPSFVWQPTRVSWRPGFVLPAIRWLEENYRVDRRVGDWLVMRRRT